jgi:hypothetical protein
MTSAYVLRVLMTMLMTNLGGLGHNDGYSVRIIFTYGRILRQWALFDLFFWLES